MIKNKIEYIYHEKVTTFASKALFQSLDGASFHGDFIMHI